MRLLIATILLFTAFAALPGASASLAVPTLGGAATDACLRQVDPECGPQPGDVCDVYVAGLCIVWAGVATAPAGSSGAAALQLQLPANADYCNGEAELDGCTENGVHCYVWVRNLLCVQLLAPGDETTALAGTSSILPAGNLADGATASWFRPCNGYVDTNCECQGGPLVDQFCPAGMICVVYVFVPGPSPANIPICVIGYETNAPDSLAAVAASDACNGLVELDGCTCEPSGLVDQFCPDGQYCGAYVGAATGTSSPVPICTGCIPVCSLAETEAASAAASNWCNGVVDTNCTCWSGAAWCLEGEPCLVWVNPGCIIGGTLPLATA